VLAPAPWAPSAEDEVDLAEAKAEKAREQALEASDAALKEIGAPISQEQLLAKDRRAAAESRNEFMKDYKLEGLVDSMEHQVGLEDRVVGRLVHQSELVRDHKYDKRTAQLHKEFDQAEKQAAKELAEADKKDQKFMREAQKSFDSYETQVRRDKAVAAKEMHEVEKQYQSVKAQKRSDLEKVKVAEAETAERLWAEAEAQRQEAINGTLENDDVLRVLDVSKGELHNLTHQLIIVSEKNDSGAWFEERLDHLRLRSTTASAHMVEMVKYKAAEFVANQKDYNDRQFVGRVARLLDDTRGDIKTLLDSNQGISTRLGGFERMNTENMTSALALALDGVMNNVEFKTHILHTDTARLRDATEAEACDVLGNMLVTNMRPAYRSIGHMKEALDNLSKVMPTIVGKKRAAAEMMEKRTRNLLNMAYMQQLAYKEGATALMTQVTPVILSRLQCAFSGASKLGSSAAVALALALSWLAQ